MKTHVALLTSFFAFGLALPVSAQQAMPVPMIAQEATSTPYTVPLREGQSSDLYTAIEAISALVPVKGVQYIDWFHQGDFSALVTTDNCGDDGCQWFFVSKLGSGYEPVGGGFSDAVTIKETEGNGRMISADGVNWAWTGSEMQPWGDIISFAKEHPPRKHDREHLLKIIPDIGTGIERVRVWDFDPFGAIWNHRLMEIPVEGPEWRRESRFILVNRLGEVLIDDNFEKRPYIFPTHAGRATMIAYTADGGLTQTQLVYNGEQR